MKRAWINHDIESNTIYVMENIIKNIKHDLYCTLLEEIKSIESFTNTRKSIEGFIKDKLNLKNKHNRNTFEYWQKRGWTDDESYAKVKDLPKLKRDSPYSIAFWTNKINPNTGVNFTEEEANFERNSRRPIRKEYWIKKGNSEEVSIQLALESKNKNNLSGAKANKNNDSKRRITSKRCVEYYTSRGYSIIEAEMLVSKYQITFSLELCIEKYGLLKGTELWNDRQLKWQLTLTSKPEEEQIRINRLKITNSAGVSAAEYKILEELLRNGIDVEHQYIIDVCNSKKYIYDFRYKNKLIEYNGDYWHCNPRKYDESYFNKKINLTAKEKWKEDLDKQNFAKSNGYDVLVIWEYDFKQNKMVEINKCIQFLMT